LRNLAMLLGRISFSTISAACTLGATPAMPLVLLIAS